jgi:YidC/Oxa1 family membrane protein insertase
VLPAPFAGNTEQQLNSQGEGPVGALAKGQGEIDRAAWRVKEKSDRKVVFETDRDGLLITKTWTMAEGEAPQKGPGYLWNLDITLKNTASEKYASDEYYLYTGATTQLRSNDSPYVSAGYFANGKAHEIHAGDFEESRRLWILWKTREKRETISESPDKMNWAGVNNQYYCVLVNAMPPGAGKFWARKFKVSFDQDGTVVKGDALHAGLGLPPVRIDPGQEQKFSYQIFAGPRSATLLDKTKEERGEAMFYGMTGGLSRLFLWLLNAFHGWTASFGVAIILLTLVVRICIWPLHIKAQRSMKRMALLAPMQNAIREKYKARPQTPDNQRAMQMEVFGLFREYQVSPLGGCLPLLLQMPIFFGYFGMLNHAVEMRGHSFLWAKDLTLPDTVFSLFGFPINPLPLVMTATMYLQMKVSPTPQSSDPNVKMQMKIFKFMPILFLFFCYAYASALALYWTVQNIISMGQTQLMKMFPEPALQKREPRKLPPVSGAGGMSLGGAEKPKGPRPPKTGGGKSAFKKKP